MNHFMIVFLTLYILTFTFVGWRLIGPSPLKRRGRSVAWTAVVLLMLLPLVSALNRMEGAAERPWVDTLSAVGFVGMGLFCMVTILVVFRDLVLLARRAGGIILRTLRRPASSGPATGPRDPERRRFLAHSTNLGILGLSGLLTGYGGYEARRRPDVVRVRVPLGNLHPDLEGFRIVQITDIHVGPTIKRDWVRAVVDQVNSLDADLIAFTGDLVDGSVAYLRDDVAPLAALRARYGSFFVTGNHEYYSGAKAWIAEARRLGFTVLMNEHRVIRHRSGDLLLAGVNDYSAPWYHVGHTSDPGVALQGAPEVLPRILLAHQPRSIYAAAAAGFDLQISGHTHGGQFFPGNLVVRMTQPYLRGLHRFQNTWVYVSRGTGYWGPPLRLGTSPEITLIELASLPA